MNERFDPAIGDTPVAVTVVPIRPREGGLDVLLPGVGSGRAASETAVVWGPADSDESPRAAAVRLLAERVGLELDPDSLAPVGVGVMPVPGGRGLRIYAFVAYDLASGGDDPGWVSLGTAMAKVDRGEIDDIPSRNSLHEIDHCYGRPSAVLDVAIVVPVDRREDGDYVLLFGVPPEREDDPLMTAVWCHVEREQSPSGAGRQRLNERTGLDPRPSGEGHVLTPVTESRSAYASRGACHVFAVVDPGGEATGGRWVPLPHALDMARHGQIVDEDARRAVLALERERAAWDVPEQADAAVSSEQGQTVATEEDPTCSK